MSNEEGQAPEIKEVYKNVKFRVSGIAWQSPQMVELIEGERKIAAGTNANELEKAFATAVWIAGMGGLRKE